MSEIPLALGEWEVTVCRYVCSCYDDPVGYSVTAVEIEKGLISVPVGWGIRLMGLVAAGYLEYDGRSFSPTDAARKQYPEKYPPPIGTAKPFSVELAEFEAWQASGKQGPCPLCGAVRGETHGRKYCFGMTSGTV